MLNLLKYFFQRHDHLYSPTQLYVADRSEDRYLIPRFKKYELFPEKKTKKKKRFKELISTSFFLKVFAAYRVMETNKNLQRSRGNIFFDFRCIFHFITFHSKQYIYTLRH